MRRSSEARSSPYKYHRQEVQSDEPMSYTDRSWDATPAAMALRSEARGAKLARVLAREIELQRDGLMSVRSSAR